MNTEENIKQQIAIVEQIYRETQAVIDGMPTEGDGRRMEVGAMAELVSAAVGMAPKDVLHMVNRYAHNNLNGYVTRGKKGGFIKGVKPVKVEKTSDVQAINALVDSDLI